MSHRTGKLTPNAIGLIRGTKNMCFQTFQPSTSFWKTLLYGVKQTMGWNIVWVYFGKGDLLLNKRRSGKTVLNNVLGVHLLSAGYCHDCCTGLSILSNYTVASRGHRVRGLKYVAGDEALVRDFHLLKYCTNLWELDLLVIFGPLVRFGWEP